MGCTTSAHDRKRRVSDASLLPKPHGQRIAEKQLALHKIQQQSAEREQKLRVEIIELRKHTERVRLALQMQLEEVGANGRAVTLDAVSELRAELSSTMASHATELRRLRWEHSAGGAHVSHLGVRLQKCKEDRETDMVRTAQIIQVLREDFSTQLSTMTQRVEAAHSQSLVAEAARAEAVIASEALVKRNESAVHGKMIELTDVVARTMKLHGLAEKRAQQAEAALAQNTRRLEQVESTVEDAHAGRAAAVAALREYIEQEQGIQIGPEGARKKARAVMQDAHLQGRLDVATALLERAKAEADMERGKRREADRRAQQWAYRAVASGIWLEEARVEEGVGIATPPLSPRNDHDESGGTLADEALVAAERATSSNSSASKLQAGPLLEVAAGLEEEGSRRPYR